MLSSGYGVVRKSGNVAAPMHESHLFMTSRSANGMKSLVARTDVGISEGFGEKGIENLVNDCVHDVLIKPTILEYRENSSSAPPSI